MRMRLFFFLNSILSNLKHLESHTKKKKLLIKKKPNLASALFPSCTRLWNNPLKLFFLSLKLSSPSISLLAQTEPFYPILISYLFFLPHISQPFFAPVQTCPKYNPSLQLADLRAPVSWRCNNRRIVVNVKGGWGVKCVNPVIFFYCANLQKTSMQINHSFLKSREIKFRRDFTEYLTVSF